MRTRILALSAALFAAPAPAAPDAFEASIRKDLAGLSFRGGLDFLHPPADETFRPLAGDLPNFAKLHDWLYRGAQPTRGGFEALARLGVRLVVNLREEGRQADEEKELVESLGMRYVNIPLSPTSRPKDEHIEQFLALFSDFENLPVLVHCYRGADRTGMAVGTYRIDFDGWKLRPTLWEMAKHRAVQPRLYNYVREYYERRNPPRESGRPREGGK